MDERYHKIFKKIWIEKRWHSSVFDGIDVFLTDLLLTSTPRSFYEFIEMKQNRLDLARSVACEISFKMFAQVLR